MIDKMVSQGASIKDDEYDVILAYLSGNYGKSIKINEATALQIQTLLDIPAAQAAAIVAHRTEHGKFATFDDLANVPGVSKERLAEEKLNFDFGG